MKLKTLKKIKKWIRLFFHNYDYGYFLQVQQIKLEEMYDFFNGPDTHIVGAKEVAKEIKEALDILDRLIADEYCFTATTWAEEEMLKQRDFEAYYKCLLVNLRGWWD